MTCIVAISDGEHVTMGADSWGASLTEHEQYRMTMPKVFRTGSYLVGFSGVWRIAQVLWKELSWPEPKAALDYDFAIKKLVPAIRGCLLDELGREALKDLEERSWGLLIAHGRGFFTVNARFEVLSVDYPFIAIGGGRRLAYGALHALHGRGLSPREMVLSALAAASQFVPGIGGPYRLLSTSSKEETVVSGSAVRKMETPVPCPIDEPAAAGAPSDRAGGTPALPAIEPS